VLEHSENDHECVDGNLLRRDREVLAHRGHEYEKVALSPSNGLHLPPCREWIQARDLAPCIFDDLL